MILSNADIFIALDESRLSISPEPTPRVGSGDVKSPYQTTAVDLRLGNEISYFPEKLPVDINLNQGSFNQLFAAHCKTHMISEFCPFSLKPNHFVLGRTMETVNLPLLVTGGKSLAARVEGKSSYARCGLLVHFTAPTIHAGFKGTITLEIINLGPFNIMLYPGTPICQLILEEVSGVPVRNDSQFQGQAAPGGVGKLTLPGTG